MRYIDRYLRENKEQQIDAHFICTLHKLLTEGLDLRKEGSRQRGMYRHTDVKISHAEYTPPMNIQVEEYMDELVAFIKQASEQQEELLKVAIAHHRFVWIHPFDNGNGRMSRLLTYAMLKKAGFDKISLLNPAAIFCMDCEQYFVNLAKADKGDAKVCWIGVGMF